MLKKNKPHEWVPWELRRINPDIFYFREDKHIPNSPFPLLIYRGFFDKEYDTCEDWLKKKFLANKWFPAPALRILNFTHYYSNTHIALGICAGDAKWQLGGAMGITMVIEKGDVLVIPAGVAVRHLESGLGFDLVAACSVNVVPDVRNEKNSNRALADRAIADIPVPHNDPILGPKEGLQTIWTPVDSLSR